jgi:BNR/Asp-box repeat
VLLGIPVLLLSLLAPTVASGAFRNEMPAASSTVPTVVSRDCGQSSAEVQDAVSDNLVFTQWMGCFGEGSIAVARSTDGGYTFGAPVALPGSRMASCTSNCPYAWDPSIVVSRSGVVYASFMVRGSGCDTYICPVVDVSEDHGLTFQEQAVLPVPLSSDPNGPYGDNDFLAVAPNGTLYITWNYGPSASQVRYACGRWGCSFAAGDFNGVIQRSTDGGKTWSTVHPISPRYPYGGVVGVRILVQPNGTLDALYLSFPTAPTTHDLGPGREYFTRSSNSGRTWSAPRTVGARAGTISPSESWIDENLSIDSAGNLYATWATQHASTDVAWLSYSRDGGRVWSSPFRVAAGSAADVVASTGVGTGIADVAWQTPSSSLGDATFVRPFSIRYGWLLPEPDRVSSSLGNAPNWPGNTFGIVALPDAMTTSRGLPVTIEWDSATGASPSQVYGSVFTP